MTIKEIAKLAGVSISTVSKIVNGKDEHINPKTRTRVLQIVKEYNFTPYGSVKKTAGAKNFLLGVLLRSTARSALILSGIVKSAQEHGYTVLLLQSQDDLTLEAKQLTSLYKNHVDGILFEPISSASKSQISDLERRQIPFYLLNQPWHPFSFQIDFEILGYSLAQKLLSRNHRTLACFPGRTGFASDGFLKGFQKCLYEYQIPFQEELVFSSAEESFVQAFIQYGVTGAVCSEFDTAYSLYELMGCQRYHIPSDLSLLSLTESEGREFLCSPLSSIRIPYQEFGSYICEKLIQLLEKSNEEKPSFSPSYTLSHEKSLSQPSFFLKKSFISIGSIHKDITFNVSTLPQSGNTLKIQNTTIALGGKGANQAVGVAKLCHPVHLIGAVGNDFDAAFILNELEKEKISSLGICRNRKKLTGKAYIYTETEGESAVTVLSGANDDLRPEDVWNCRCLFSNACFCLISSEIPLDTVLAAAKLARETLVTTIFKPSTLRKMPEDLYRTIDILVPNRKEAAALCPGIPSVEQQAEYFFQKGIPVVIITLGHEGCYVRTAQCAKYYPAVHLETVDTTGGADAFISALAVHLFEGHPLTDAVQIAALAAAFCVSRQGGAVSMIDRQSLDAYLAKTRPDLIR